jgi:primosomal protein N' (replication factor Y)
VAREFALNFPDVRFARMDSDTTRGKGAHEAILGDYSAGRTKVLIGTQMLAKGFDFPRLHFVGVVNADGGLTMPDFRGAEKTFQLLTQVAGRCGRGDEPGEVVVQTYRPEHYALQAAKGHDYEAFAARELPVREELFYPPFSRLVLVSAEAPTEEKAADPLDALRDHLEETVTGAGKLRLMGPAPAPLQRIEKRHRWQLLIKLERSPEALAKLREGLRSFPGGLTDLKLDVDPMNLL